MTYDVVYSVNVCVPKRPCVSLSVFRGLCLGVLLTVSI